MEDFDGFREKAERFQNLITRSAQSKENVFIYSSYTADGICSAIILQCLIAQSGGHAQIRCGVQPGRRFLERLRTAAYDLVIFVDVGSTFAADASQFLGNKWVVVDHHELGPHQTTANDAILNCFQFGFDGASAISSSGICYFIAEKSRSQLSAFLSISGALADDQDVGPRRSLISLNSKVLEQDASTFGVINSSVDLLFSGRESRPVHESIASTTTCFIPGLTGNKDACLASLRGAGIELKAGVRWRTISDLSEDEKQRVLEAIVPHLAGTSLTVQDLVGTTYWHGFEDEFSLMRDARDLSSLLNSFGRTGRPSLGVALCLSPETDLSAESEAASKEYRSELMRSVQTLASSEERILEKDSYLLFVGDGIVKDRMTGPSCKVLSTFSRARNKIVMVRTTTPDGEVKVSLRLGNEASDFNLGALAMSLSETSSGTAGGLRRMAGARFPIAKQQEFQSEVDVLLQDQRSTLKQS